MQAAIETLSEHHGFGGVQGFYQHQSSATGLPMRFGVYQPPQAAHGAVPTLMFLAGLTCSEETFAIKAGAQRIAAELGLMLITPDTSPRSTGIVGADDAWDFGHGAGFYLDATQQPWAKHFRMETYISQELPALIAQHFPARANAESIFGHSMGGHGAITLALRNENRYRSVSAFAPICAPMQCAWGTKAFMGYLGDDKKVWAEHDATQLILRGRKTAPLLIDQGLNDKFLAEQLLPEKLAAACEQSGQTITLRKHAGYDHSYYFIASFVEEHLRFHARALGCCL